MHSILYLDDNAPEQDITIVLPCGRELQIEYRCYDKKYLPSIDILTEGYSIETNNPYMSLAECQSIVFTPKD